MGKTKSPEKAEGKVKKVKKVKKATAEAKTEPEQKEKPKFSTVEVFSKPGAMAPLFEQFTESEVGAPQAADRISRAWTRQRDYSQYNLPKIQGSSESGFLHNLSALVQWRQLRAH